MRRPLARGRRAWPCKQGNREPVYEVNEKAWIDRCKPEAPRSWIPEGEGKCERVHRDIESCTVREPEKEPVPLSRTPAEQQEQGNRDDPADCQVLDECEQVVDRRRYVPDKELERLPSIFVDAKVELLEDGRERNHRQPRDCAGTEGFPDQGHSRFPAADVARDA